jgi:YNFM family putative membrane transporter
MHPLVPLPSTPITAGTPEFSRINRAMVFGGFSTFSLLYCVQPVMPMLANQFKLTPVESSWILSISTLTLAVSLIISSAFSERVGRKPMMGLALALAAITTVLCTFANDFTQLLLLRAILGIALGGMPAVAIAYLGEEIEGKSLGQSIGLFIAGSAFGGMVGRLVSAFLSDHFSWRVAFAVLGAAGMYAAWDFWRSLPQARNFQPARHGIRDLCAGARQHLSDPGLAMLFCLAFLLMGCFVSLYNYLGYRLLAAPFNLSHSGMGAISVLYVLGIASAVWVGRLVDRVGRRDVLWLVLLTMLCGLLLTLSQSLPIVILGTAVFTFGFFASHSVASSWVARRAIAHKALASALYLFFYYLGSSLVGSFTGLLWQRNGWPGVVFGLGSALGVAMLITLRMRSLQPVAA